MAPNVTSASVFSDRYVSQWIIIGHFGVNLCIVFCLSIEDIINTNTPDITTSSPSVPVNGTPTSAVIFIGPARLVSSQKDRLRLCPKPYISYISYIYIYIVVLPLTCTLEFFSTTTPTTPRKAPNMGHLQRHGVPGGVVYIYLVKL